MNGLAMDVAGSPPVSDFSQVVEALAAANTAASPQQRRRHQPLPSRETLADVVADLRAVLFPAHFGPSDLSPAGIRYYIGHRLDAALQELFEQVRRGLRFACTHLDGHCLFCEQRAVEVMRAFATALPQVRALLGSDVQAAYERDPAATSPDEAVFCYPGITAITHHRLAHQLYQLGVPLIPRIISELAHAATGIDIHPGARIGGSFFIDHGTGVVIGETCIIGERVCLFQGVTLGARSFALDPQGLPMKGRPRHPVVEDDVIIYAGATVLGRITIGRGSIIGGNVWLTRGVPPGSRITQALVRDDLFHDGSGI